ncbi:hypothetical protein AX16_008572 [Volvariella volvacea WC 439]|nr:hypothetical protein AX16_008572 [Volvariella volvacea WC 439]
MRTNFLALILASVLVATHVAAAPVADTESLQLRNAEQARDVYAERAVPVKNVPAPPWKRDAKGPPAWKRDDDVAAAPPPWKRDEDLSIAAAGPPAWKREALPPAWRESAKGAAPPWKREDAESERIPDWKREGPSPPAWKRKPPAW